MRFIICTLFLTFSHFANASELPPKRVDTPHPETARIASRSPMPLPLPDGTLPKMPSPVLYYKNDRGELVRLLVPSGLYVRNDAGKLVPIEDMFEESDLESTSSEEEPFSLEQ